MAVNALAVMSPEGGLSRYLSEIRKFPMLPKDTEFMLAKRWQEHGDSEAAHQMVTSHLRLVAKIAMGYRGYGLPIGEVISEGNVGLMQAVKKFDPDKGFRLATYAMWWIRASIQEYILRSWSLVKMGTTAAQKKLFFNLRKAKSEISAFEEGDMRPEQVSFIATKLGATGHAAAQAQIEQSFRRLGRERLDLIAVHNLQDIDAQLPRLRDLKSAGRIRYVGATTSSDRQYQAFEAMMKRETLDFVQVDFALDNRGAAHRLLPLARDRNMGVMINLPFGRGRLFEATRGKALPPWAAEFDCASWAQFFLKYIISHDAVTCAVPGMAKPEYVVDNMGAVLGRLPDPATRRRMETFIDAL